MNAGKNQDLCALTVVRDSRETIICLNMLNTSITLTTLKLQRNTKHFNFFTFYINFVATFFKE